MDTSRTLVKVIVPIHRKRLEEYEWISLRQNRQVLKAHPFVFIRPSGLDINHLLKEFPECQEEVFDDEYFCNIAGYNRLMTSADFYKRFSDTDYLLICQLDVFVFRDELLDWCNKGYDYIGAPWLVPTLFRFPLLKQWRKYFHNRYRTEKDFKVGNGGFSLRKVSSHLQATKLLHNAIRTHLSRQRHFSNEDLFFAVEVNKHGMHFSYPDYKKALQFSFDKYPVLCYKENRYRLPFGCHAWYKGKMKDFWFPIIFSKLEIPLCNPPWSANRQYQSQNFSINYNYIKNGNILRKKIQAIRTKAFVKRAFACYQNCIKVKGT